MVAALGSGGMGEVYRARDTRLDRDVAIKVLPAHLTGDANAVARFAREAKAVAALSHPNILAIFDVGTDNGVAFAAMELLEGETLRQRLAGGALPWKKAAHIGAQIAQGLAAAHDKGIVHRDLKPENIFVLADGHVKILDFGLARQDVASSNAANAMTEKVSTEPGIVLGTVGYMSPEQVKGQPADRRSDIFSLGCILFEAVTGTRAFLRETTAETMTAILREDPPDEGLSAHGVPGAFQQILRHCLEKRPDERFQSARDLAFALQALPASSTGSGTTTIAAIAPSPRRRVPQIAAALAIVAAASAAGGWLLRGAQTPTSGPAAAGDSIVSNIMAPPEAEFAFHHGFSLSPDRKWLAFAARTSVGAGHIWLRSLSDDRSKPLAGTENGTYPSWSPDSKHIAFFRTDTRELRRVPIDGGPAQLICAIPDTRDPRVSWGFGDDILIGLDAAGGTGGSPRPLLRVPGAGGTPTPMKGFESIVVIEPSPIDEDRFVYRDSARGEAIRTFVASISGAHAPIEIAGLKGEAFYRFVPGTHTVLLRRAGVLRAQEYDPSSMQLVGEPKVLGRGPGSPLDWLALSATGDTLVMLAPEVADAGNPGDPLSQLQWLDRQGQVVGTLGGGPRRYWSLRLSPDGTKAAVNPDEDIWVYNQSPAMRTRITTAASVDFAPVWSPDGKRILFKTDALIALTSSAEVTPPVEIPEIVKFGTVTVSDWSQDNRFLVLNTGRSGTSDIQRFDLATKTMSPLVVTPFDEFSGRLTTDARWIAYASNSTGRTEVFVKRVDGSTPAVQVSVDGGRNPFWRRDGKELFFVGPNSELIAVDASSLESRGVLGAGKTLFRVPLNNISNYGAIDIAPDGRFLANVLTTPEPLTLIRNWRGLIKN
ncbi:MAG TPA: protein kinase [Vicinamibacterales bacterium]|nr:protein kinase [Vicinamibacterales bacterium]